MNDGFNEAEADRLVEGTNRHERMLYPFAAEVAKANVLAGQKFIGAVDGVDVVELVFDGDGGYNMLTIDFARRTVFLGGVNFDLLPGYGEQHHALRPETA